MGGIGSGRWYRWDRKATTEEMRRVDVRYLRKQGCLRPGNAGILSWSIGDHKTGSVRYLVGYDRLVLKYRARAGDNWDDIEESVQFDRTPCNYGGERLWLLCPGCGRRVAVLYGGVGFRCRHCSNLTYASQQEGYMDRMMRKARKVRGRLGASGDLTEPLWKKPKGMHWKTFERLAAQERKANQASSIAMAGILGKLEGSWRAR